MFDSIFQVERERESWVGWESREIAGRKDWRRTIRNGAGNYGSCCGSRTQPFGLGYKGERLPLRSVVPTVSDTRRLDSLLCGLVSPLFRFHLEGVRFRATFSLSNTGIGLAGEKGRGGILKVADVSLLAEPEIPISESEAGLTPRHNRSFINRGS